MKTFLCNVLLLTTVSCSTTYADIQKKLNELAGPKGLGGLRQQLDELKRGLDGLKQKLKHVSQPAPGKLTTTKWGSIQLKINETANLTSIRKDFKDKITQYLSKKWGLQTEEHTSFVGLEDLHTTYYTPIMSDKKQQKKLMALRKT